MLLYRAIKRKLLARSRSKSFSGNTHPDKVIVWISTKTQEAFPFQMEQSDIMDRIPPSLTWNKTIPKKESKGFFGIPYLYESDGVKQTVTISFTWKGIDNKITLNHEEIKSQIDMGYNKVAHPILKSTRSYPSLYDRTFNPKIDCIQLVHNDILIRIYLQNPLTVHTINNKWFITNITISKLDSD